MNIIITRREPLHIPDGINTHIFTLGEAFSKFGHKVTYISTYYSEIKDIERFYPASKFEVCSIFSKQNKFPQKLYKVAFAWATSGIKLLKNLKPDFVIHNGAIPFFPKDIPHVFVVHDLEHRFIKIKKMQDIFKKFCYKSAHFLVATTIEIKEKLIEELNFPDSFVTVIPTCYNLMNYKSKNLDERKRVILHIGTASYKNPITTIKAFELIHNDFKDVETWIIGEVTSEIKDLLRKIDRSVLEKIKFLGKVSDSEYKEILSSCLIVSVPSIYRLPVASPTVVEAMASGTPVITTKSITRDIALDGTSCLVRNPSAEEFADAICKLLNDAKLWENLSKNGQRVSQKFDYLNVAKQYIELFSKIN